MTYRIRNPNSYPVGVVSFPKILGSISAFRKDSNGTEIMGQD